MGVDQYANYNDQDHDADGMTELSLGAVVVPQDEVNKAECLRIEVIEGPEANRGTVLDINAQGLVGSQRSKNDGCTILGSLKQSAKGDVYNDFVIQQDENDGIGDRHMIIKYNMADRQYYIRDLGKGSGTFVRLDVPLTLKNGFIISFGTSHLTVNFFQGEARRRGTGGEMEQSQSKQGTSSSDRIQLKFIDGPKLDQVFTFKSNEKILIGRMPSCNIKFDDNQLSRLQCTIEYIDGNWILKDGDGSKSSTNGTWLFVDELFKIYDGMVFKAGQTLFRTRKLKPGSIQGRPASTPAGANGYA